MYTQPTQTSSAAKALTESKGLKVKSTDIIYTPNEDSMVTINDELVFQSTLSMIGNLTHRLCPP
jgi:hypothetical protein